MSKDWTISQPRESLLKVSDYQKEKHLVRTFMAAFEKADTAELTSILSKHTSVDYLWRGMHPFYEQDGARNVVENFWLPLRASFTSLERREDIFFAGDNIASEEKSIPGIWTCSMGHFRGLHDQQWLGIPPTRKVAHIPYAEFHRIEDGLITESALFIDIVKVMQQSGLNPFPHQTGACFIHPGPKTHDGILTNHYDPKEGKDTIELLNRMIDDLSALNQSGEDRCPPEWLARTWRDDMTWYGPGGIGAAYTIPRYQEQHQYPFREGLTDKSYNGHVTRFAEGNYACFFGWPNLNNRNIGWLGLPKGDHPLAEMRVVDVYRRDGDKLAENWVFIDVPYYLMQHGIDLLKNPNALKELHGAQS